MQQNGADGGTERNVERNGPFLGKRCRRATQTEGTVLEHFLDAYRITYLYCIYALVKEMTP